MSDVVGALPFPIVERTSEAPITDRIGQLEAILRAMKLTIHARDKAFGVMVFPSARMHAGNASDERQDYREILGVLSRLDIPFVDYYEKTKGLRWRDLYSGDQGHWRPSGHQEAATLLRSLLVTLVSDAH